MSRCQCITLKGTQCSRSAKLSSKFCYQHQDCRNVVSSTSSSTYASTAEPISSYTSSASSASTTSSSYVQVPPPPSTTKKIRRPLPIISRRKKVTEASVEAPTPKTPKTPKTPTAAAVKAEAKAVEAVEAVEAAEAAAEDAYTSVIESLEKMMEQAKQKSPRSPSTRKEAPKEPLSLGLVSHMMESYPPWISQQEAEEAKFVDIGKYRFGWPKKIVYDEYLVFVVPTLDKNTGEKWNNPYYLANSTNMFRYATRSAGSLYKGYHYVSSTFPHIKLQAFLHRAYKELKDLEPYRGISLITNSPDILEIVDGVKIYDDPTFNTINMIPCGIEWLRFTRNPDMIVSRSGLRGPLVVADLEEGPRAFYEEMLDVILPTQGTNEALTLDIQDDDYRKILEMLASLVEKNYVVIPATRKFLFDNRFIIGDGTFNMSIYSVMMVKKSNIYERFKLIYSVYTYKNSRDGSRDGTYNNIIAIQLDDNDVNRLGIPNVIVAAGAYVCKTIEYHAQSMRTFPSCTVLDPKYCFIGYVLTDLWPLNTLT